MKLPIDSPDSFRFEAGEFPQKKQPALCQQFNWTMTALCSWLVIGLYVDGWAHNHLAAELETFFTPWHALLYCGLLAVASFLTANLIQNHALGYPWRRALPVGYGLSMLGVVIFFTGGVCDLIWHTILGIEVSVEALLSPPHLVLASGGALMVSGSFRSAWQQVKTQSAPSLATQLPMLVSLTLLLSVLTFFTQFAHPLTVSWVTHDVTNLKVDTEIYVMNADGSKIAFASKGNFPSSDFLRQSVGIGSILLQTVLVMGLVLLAVYRWTLPLGSLTVVFTLNAALLSVLKDQYLLILVALVTGIAADLLLNQLKPSAGRTGALRVFAFTLPMIFYGFYFLTLILTENMGWSIPLWTGSIVMAGVVGWLLSYVLVPPLKPAQ